MPKKHNHNTSCPDGQADSIRFQTLFENMLEGVAIYSAVDDGDDFVFEDINKAGQSISRVSKNEVWGRRVTRVFPGIKQMGLLDAFRQVWKTGQPMIHPVSLYKDERISQWVENSIFKLPGGEIVAVYSDETEKMRSLEKLRNNQRRLGMVLQGSRDGFWDWNIRTGELYLSPRWYEILGYEIGDVKTHIDMLWTICHPEDYPRVMKTIQQHIEGEPDRPYEMEHRFKTGDGEWKWILGRGKVFRDRNGIAVRMAGTATDISDRKAAEKELEREKNLFQTIIGSIPVMITRYDPDANMLYLNREFEEKTGWSTEEVQHIDLMEQVYPDRKYRRQALEYMRQASTEWREFDLRSRSGETIKSEWSNIRLEDGTQVGIGIDITRRKMLEKELHESRELLEATGRMARVGGWELDAETLEVRWTRETYRIHEVPFEHKPSFRSAIDFFHPDDRDRLSEAIQGALQKGESYDLVIRFITARGRELWTRTICHPEVVDGKTIKLRGMFQDITDLKRARDQIQRLNRALEKRVLERTRQLEAANRELESFAYSVSHDLRAPLRAITGFAEIIAERHRSSLNEQGRHYFDNIVEAGEQMGHLIEDLLTYSRLGRKAVVKKPVDLRDLFSHIRQNFSDKIQTVKARIQLPENLPVISSDRSMMYVILSNIINNALTYHEPGAYPDITVSWQRENNGIGLAVRDNGIGIAPEHHRKIFDIFQRLQPQSKYPGTGIGLGLVKKAAGLLGGNVYVESRPGKGSTFHVKLPGCMK